jgi:hypothetical protein
MNKIEKRILILKDVDIVLLPTDKFTTTTICKCIRENGLLVDALQLDILSNPPDKKELKYCGFGKDQIGCLDRYFEPQHTYIVNNDRIEVDDYYIDDCGEVRQSVMVYDEDYWSRRPNYKKIVATTNEDLSLPTIAVKFLKNFVENKRYRNETKYDYTLVFEGINQNNVFVDNNNNVIVRYT